MLSIEDVDYNWQVLEVGSVSVGDTIVREFDEVEISGTHPLFAISSAGHRQLLIDVELNHKLQEDISSSGVQVLSRKMEDGNKLRQYLIIVCLKTHLNELFTIIITEILNRLVKDSARPDIAAIAVLDRWRELLEKDFTEKPDLQTLIGVFGELWQLRKIAAVNPGCASFWRGPEGYRHDIAGASLSLEVKTSLSAKGRSIIVHGAEQLEPPADGSLYLAVVKLERVEQAGENLQDLINGTTDLGGSRTELLTKLALIGFTSQTLELCKDFHFQVKENRVYRVDVTFPRLVSDSFVNGRVPSGVVKLEYTLDLSNEPPFPLSEVATDAFYNTFDAQIGL